MLQIKEGFCKIAPTKILEAVNVCPHRLARSRTPGFHPGDRGSNPLGDAIYIAGSV